eukprot:COSAG02_NODE_29857_length_561_cov_1.419913_1_plen_62_part_10
MLPHHERGSSPFLALALSGHCLSGEKTKAAGTAIARLFQHKCVPVSIRLALRITAHCKPSYS